MESCGFVEQVLNQKYKNTFVLTILYDEKFNDFIMENGFF
jgi:hypothetical protein